MEGYARCLARGMYEYRTSVRNFAQKLFGKRACLHCFLTEDTLGSDSEIIYNAKVGAFASRRLAAYRGVARAILSSLKARQAIRLGSRA